METLGKEAFTKEVIEKILKEYKPITDLFREFKLKLGRIMIGLKPKKLLSPEYNTIVTIELLQLMKDLVGDEAVLNFLINLSKITSDSEMVKRKVGELSKKRYEDAVKNKPDMKKLDKKIKELQNGKN